MDNVHERRAVKPITSSPISAWFRVIRPLNLAIIAGAILVLRYSFYNTTFHPDTFTSWKLEMLFALPLVFIAAGGNIINDYFDIKEDRINKPERALVGRVLKRRIALVSHWALTAIGIVMAGVLTWKIGNYIPIVIAVSIAIVLFFYSAKLKGRVLVGNVIVAASLASVIPFAFADQIATSFSPTTNIFFFANEFGFLLGLTFLIAFIRELAKDIEDIEGDKLAGHLTFPIVYGARASWRLISVLTIILLALTLLLFTAHYDYSDLSHWAFFGITLLIAYFTWQKKATQLSAWLKLLLLAGLIFCYFHWAS